MPFIESVLTDLSFEAGILIPDELITLIKDLTSIIPWLAD